MARERTMTPAAFSAVVRCVHRIAEEGLADRELLDRFALHRDEAAFAELVRRHGPMVLATCWGVLRQQQDAEDAFQAAFLILARKAGPIRGRDSLGGWLYQVARRLALRARASGALRRARLTELAEGLSAPRTERTQDALGALHEELERLPEQYRTPVVLCYLEGRTQAEAAGILATTAGAVNSRLKRARELLRQRLARRGLTLSGLAEPLAESAARGALSPALVEGTARAAFHFATGRATGSGASALAVALAKGALRDMITLKVKALSALVLVAGFLTAGALLVLPPTLGEAAAPPVEGGSGPPRAVAAPLLPRPPAKARPPVSCIVLWMRGGPSQIDTFDPKPGHLNGSLFPAIDTNVKGVQISKALSRLVKQMDRLAIFRAVTHREGDHGRATYLMRTGYENDGLTSYPELGSVLGKELGDARPGVPRYVSIAVRRGPGEIGPGPGFLGPRYASLAVDAGDGLELPPVEAFEELAKGRGKAQRKAIAKAFDLKEEKPAARAAYGPGDFGQACLLARRLVERGVPVVEVTLGGWDMHANVGPGVTKLGGELDAGFSALLKDLHDRKRLDTTLVVWMGEFGRTPVINAQLGRDHWPRGFSVVLAGCGIKGGQVVGKTSADGARITARPIAPPELLATVYQAVGIDPTRQNRTPEGQKVSLVERGSRPVKEALR